MRPTVLLLLTARATGLCLALALGLSVAAVAGAQTDQTGVLLGVVTDADGAPIDGAVVLLSRPDGAYAQNATSDTDGRYRVGFLTPGDYTVTVQAPGFGDFRAEGVDIDAASRRTLDVTLQSGADTIADEVTVTAARPLIERSTTEQSTTLDGEITEVLPIARTATDLVKLTPGGSNSALWGGSTSQANSYKLDGVSVSQPGEGGDFLLPNVDWIEEFQVRGLGAGAEYGNFQGGLVNIVTKSGSNQVRGGARLNLEDASLNSSTLDAREAGFEDDSRWEANVNLGGPLITDQLYYFVSYQQVERERRIVDDDASQDGRIVFLDLQEERTESKALAKLTWQPNDRGLLKALVGWDEVETENRGLDSFTAPAAAETQDSPSLVYNLAYTGGVGDQTFFELKLTGYDGDDDRTPKNGDLPSVRILGGDRETFRNAVFTRLDSPSSNGLSASVDRFVETGSISHQLKIGGEYTEGSWNERRIRSGGFTWRPEEDPDVPFIADDPSTWGFISSDWGSGISLDAETVNAALYVQDYVDLGERVRLSAGLRWSQWQGNLTPGFGAPGAGSFEAVDDSAFDPRLGAVIDVNGDGSWVGKVHWGRYHQSLFALMFDRALGGAVFQDEEYWDWIGPGLPDVDRVYTLAEREQFFELFDIVSTASEVGPVLDYDQPFVDQLVVSLEHAVRPDWKLGLTYVRRENDDILALVDRNRESNYTEFNGVEVIDFRSGDPVLGPDGAPLVLDRVFVGNDDILGLGWAPGLSDADVAALAYDEDFVLTNAEGASRTMDQVQLVLEGRTERLDLQASLVWTDLVGDFFSVSGYDDPDGLGAGSFVEPNLRINDFGRLRGVNEWEAKLRLSADLPWKLRGGLYAFYGSGEPYTPTYSIDNRNHDFVAADGEVFNFRHFSNVNGEEIFLETRGTREVDSYSILDLHLDRLVDLGRTDLVLGFDVFNLFNEDAVRDLKTSVNDQETDDPTTLFEAPRRRLTPRTLRLYASLRW
ncbi:MAG: carboxypeptidase regulatory-like domain-containing protein [Acidobacteriota bacterium]